MQRLDILFIIPMNMPDFAGDNVKDAIEPPAKARFIASYLMRRGISVHLIDANVTGQTPEQIAEEVRALNPRLVWIAVYGFNPSASPQTMPSARLFAWAIKNVLPNIPIIFSGTHPAALPEETLLQEPIDFVCPGEGPITAHELLEALKAGGDIRKVRSLWYRENGGAAFTMPAPLIDLNQEPVSQEAWRLMDPRWYRAHPWHEFYQNMKNRGAYANPYSREGCPFHCDFCNIQAPYRDGELLQVKQNRNSYRELSPELFVDELAFLAEEFGVRSIKIPDEMFGLGKHPLRIATLIKERFGDYFNIWCYYRVDTCRPEELELLRSAGFRWIALGIESANSTVRSGQDKGFSDDKVYQVVQKLYAAGIEGALNYIFGLPGDTIETMQATLDMADALNSVYGNFYCTQALPGSELHRQARASGYPLPEREGGPGWSGYAQYSHDSEPYYTGTELTPAAILDFRDKAHRHYYSRLAYREMLRQKDHCGQPALDSIEQWMAAIAPDKLTRRLLGHERPV